MSQFIPKNLSNAFSTGGGGVNFEQNIQALFLLTLLIDGLCPVLNRQTSCVHFQAKHLGFSVDDIVVKAKENDVEYKLLCQVKHTIVVSDSDITFQEVITAAWNDFQRPTFNLNRDAIALVTGQIAHASTTSLRQLHDQACASIDEKEFLYRINQTGFVSGKTRSILATIKADIEKANNNVPVSDSALWNFCKSFQHLLFDLDYSESINRTLATSLIKCNSTIPAHHVWSMLVDYAGRYNQLGACISIDNIDEEIKNCFTRFEPITSMIPMPIGEIDPLLPIITLIGTWREDNSFDREVIERISGRSYPEFEQVAHSLLHSLPEYIQLKNSVWKVINRKELLLQCQNALYDKTIESVFTHAATILSQPNKRYLSSKKFFVVPTSGCFDNSEEMRKGIVEGICLLSNLTPEPQYCDPKKTLFAKTSFLQTLFKNCTWIRWASISDQLIRIAEILPKTFLNLLEDNIIHNIEAIQHLYPQKEDEILFQSNLLAPILWSLEVLAWVPEHLVSSIRCLGLIENIKHDQTNWANSAQNSIVSILLPWMPQTLADSEQQHIAFKCLQKEMPNVAWHVLCKLLPNRTSTTTNNPRPRYLNLSIPEEIHITYDDLNKQHSYYLELAVELSNSDSHRLSSLSNQVRYMNLEIFSKYLETIRHVVDSYTEEDKCKLWLSLLGTSLRLSSKKNKCSAQPDIIEHITDLVSSLEPSDIRLKYRKLYLDDYYYTYDDDDWGNRWKLREAERTDAIIEIYNECGLIDTYAFGCAVGKPYDVGNKLGTHIAPLQLAMVFESYHANLLSRDFLQPLLSSFAAKNSPQALLETGLSAFSTESISEILAMIPCSNNLITVVNSLLPIDNAAYWKQATIPYLISEEEGDALPIICHKLVECGRYYTAINLLGRSELFGEVELSFILDLLTCCATKQISDNDSLDHHAVRQVIKYMQESPNCSTEDLSDIEFLYLPLLEMDSDVKPVHLYSRISSDPEFFCSLIELYYKKHSEPIHTKEIPEGVAERLFHIFHYYNVIPGRKDDSFDPVQFRNWISFVKRWSTQNDRYAVTMHTVGIGLSYINPDGLTLPPNEILMELNSPENDDMRQGYISGTLNQRGVHWIDPSGKPEIDLAIQFEKGARQAVESGYARYSDLLISIANHYRAEADFNKQRHKEEQESI